VSNALTMLLALTVDGRLRDICRDWFTTAHFPKSAPHRRNTFPRTSESYGHQQTMIVVPLSI
jgi:hypothetical protein